MVDKADSSSKTDSPEIPHREKIGETPAPAGVPRVLLVEDSEETQLLIARALNQKGMFVDTAGDGIDGIRKALSEDYDVILMDIEMPRMDGFSATKALKNFGLTQPIIAVTGVHREEVQDHQDAGGFAGFIFKPLDLERLIDAVYFYSKKGPRTRRPLH